MKAFYRIRTDGRDYMECGASAPHSM